MLLKRRPLVRHDVDDKAVGSICRGRLAPAADQIGTQQYQQHQRQQPDGQTADLHHGITGPRGQLARSQYQPARCGIFLHHPAQQLHGQPGHGRKQQRRSGKPAYGNTAQPGITADCQQQSRKTQHTHTQYPRRNRSEHANVAPQHAQRRHLGQLQHRRHAKCQQQRHAHAHAKSSRPCIRRRQPISHQPRQQLHKHMVQAPAQRYAQHTGQQAHQCKFQPVRCCNRALAQAQHTQHGRSIQMALGKCAGGQRHCHCRQQGRQQCHQTEEFFATLQRASHLGAARFQGFHPPPATPGVPHLLLGPLGVTLQGCRIFCSHSQAPGNAAGGLYQTGSGQILGANHHTRRKRHEARTTVGL